MSRSGGQSSSITAQINYILSKLYKIDNELGGTEKAKAGKGKETQFQVIKVHILKQLYLISQKQDERDTRAEKVNRDHVIISLETEIKGIFIDIDKQLQQLDKILNKQIKNPKKYPKAIVQHNDKIFQNLKSQLEHARCRERGEEQLESLNGNQQTLAELQNMLMEKGEFKPPPYNVEPDEEELQAIERWKREAEKQDEALGIINQDLEEIIRMAKQQHNMIGVTNDLISKVGKKVDEETQVLKGHNANLKKIILAFRSPSRFCMDIILLAILIVVGFMVIKMVKSGKG